MVEQLYAQYRDPEAVEQDEPAPAQRADADRRRTRPAGARGLALVHRRARRATSVALPLPASSALLGRGGARRRRRACSPPACSIQLRRLRVPDAVPGARHAAVRGRPRRPPTRTHDARRRRPGRARALLARFAGLHVLVVGDVMLDRFIVGRVTRISPEAPVPVVKFESRTCARSAARPTSPTTSRRSAAQVALVGVVGARSRRQTAPASSSRRQASARRSGRRSATAAPTEKVRIVTERNQQVARIDYEEDADVDGRGRSGDCRADRARSAAARRVSSSPTT